MGGIFDRPKANLAFSEAAGETRDRGTHRIKKKKRCRDGASR